jgi:Cdc6-like AAA superfamily ATPase
MMNTCDSKAVAQAIRKCFGKFPRTVAVLNRLTELMEDEPCNTEPPHLMITGESGTGKSTVLRYFRDKYPRIEHADFTEIPILYLEVPAKTSVRMLAGLMLQELGSKFWDKGDEVARTFQLKTLLRACKTRMVVLDEVNHLVDRGGVKTHYAVADWIKQLGQPGGPAVVLAGTPRAKLLMETNLQLRTRFGEVLPLLPFSSLPGHIGEFAAVLRAFDKLLGDVPRIDLSAHANVEKIAFATGGRLRVIRDLLVRSISIADSLPEPKIDLGTLARAFCEVVYLGAPPNRNPFHKEFSGLPLVKPGEPFAPEVDDRGRKR